VLFIFINFETKAATFAKLRYVTLKLGEVYIEFFKGSCSMHNKKWKKRGRKTRKVYVHASFRLSIENMVLYNQRHPSA
jgi:uncharacterized protein (UPF0303 family)